MRRQNDTKNSNKTHTDNRLQNNKTPYTRKDVAPAPSNVYKKRIAKNLPGQSQNTYIRENEIPKPTFQFGLKIFIL